MNENENTTGLANQSDTATSGTSGSAGLLEKIEKLAGEVCVRENCELYDVEIAGAGNARVLRVYVDRMNEAGQSIVGIEDCSNVSRGLNLILDVEDVIPGGAYNLEVSSPGLDRRLRKAAHFQRAVGKKIWIQLTQNLGSLGAQKASLQATKKFEDVLKGFEDNKLHFEMQGELVKVPLSVVDKAKVVFVLIKGSKEPKRK